MRAVPTATTRKGVRWYLPVQAMSQLQLRSSDAPVASISPFREMGAYEALWAEDGASFKTIADRFRKNPDALPSDLVPYPVADEMAAWVRDHFVQRGVKRFGVRVHRAGEYPPKLRDARHPVELLYFQGLWNLVEAPGVAVVGTRNPSDDGIKRARRIVRELQKGDYTVVSGLAKGIDTAAHRMAMKLDLPTIAVIGTPLGHFYPSENRNLQEQIARDHLVISQVPVRRYSQQTYKVNRFFFPERNVTMAALTLATVIVEAGETSGTLVQARAALHQGRKLFILESAFKRKDLTWPARFAEKGAIRLRDPDQLLEELKA